MFKERIPLNYTFLPFPEVKTERNKGEIAEEKLRKNKKIKNTCPSFFHFLPYSFGFIFWGGFRLSG